MGEWIDFDLVNKLGKSAGASERQLFWLGMAGMIGNPKQLINQAAKKSRSIWTSTKFKNGVENAFGHFTKHGADFEAKNALDYVRQAEDFLHNPPAGALSKTRANGDVVRFDPATDAFGVMDKAGSPRTFYKPDPAQHGYSTNLDYFNAQ
jgi:pyocin large subunit-like protein